MCVTLSLSVCAGFPVQSEYLTVSTVCVHPLLCVIVKKQRHLFCSVERSFVHKSHGRFVH